MRKLTLVIPVWNEEKNVTSLIERIHKSLRIQGITYEIIFVDDHSTDQTAAIIKRLEKKYPLVYLVKQGKKGKAFSLVEGFALAKYPVIAMIDADLQYPPEALPEFYEKIEAGADIVVANRSEYKESRLRRFISNSFKTLFGKLLFGLHHDVQAGMKMFTKDVLENIQLQPTAGWAFDLEFLYRSKQMGYRIENYDIIFEKRHNGKSKVSFLKVSFEIGINALTVKLKQIKPVHIAPEDPQSMKGAGVGYKRRRYITHTTLHYSRSAIQTFIAKQVFIIYAIFILLILSFIIFPILTLQIIVGILSSIYFIDVLFNLFLILKSLHIPQEITVSAEEMQQLNDKNLPIYSILCPLYKEAHIIPHFLEAIGKLDYPKNKLDVLLLLEEDDTESIDSVKNMHLPSYVRTIVVPHSLPKTKPKACNYGLSQAKGEYLVIYDAEDIPDPLQLKKSYVAFQKVNKNVLCLQAKLNYYNPHQNMLTRFFTAEYSLWFDVTLTGLQSINTSIPLGGTSNHFRVNDLNTLEGWDPFNVTEDADLGIRLFKRGYQTAIIDSTTMEEANSRYGNWLRQRSRWIKGYMQTYLVHTRENISFFKQKKWHALAFHLTIGGKIAFILINPLLWLMTVAYFALYAFVGPAIESLYPSVVFYMAASSLVFGNFLFLYYYMVGCAKKGQWDLVKYVYFVPIYWLLISVAGFMALYQLIFKPHYWEKTVHGLHLTKKQKKKIVEVVVETEEVSTGYQFPTRFKKQLTSLMSYKGVFRAGGLLLLTSIIANLLTIVFYAYLGRVLDLGSFALVCLLGSFYSIASIFFNPLNSTVNYRSGFLLGKFNSQAAFQFWRYIRKYSLYAGLFLSWVWLFFSPLLYSYFHGKSVLLFVSFAVIIFGGFAHAIDKGYLTSRLKFKSLAILAFVEPIIMLTIAIGLVNLHLVAYTFFALPAAFFLVFMLGWFLVARSSISDKATDYSQHDISYFPKKFIFQGMLSGVSTISFLGLDILLAVHYLSIVEAGQYALIALIGKIIYFLGGLSSSLFISYANREVNASKNPLKTLYYLVLFSFLLTFVGFVCFGIFGYAIVPLMFGAKALGIIPYIVIYSFAMMCFSIARIISSFYQTHKLYSFPVIGLLLGILQIVFVVFNHQSIYSLILIMTIVGLLNLMFTMVMHYKRQTIRTIESNIIDLLGLFSAEKIKDINYDNNLRILIFNWRDTKHVWAGGAESYVHQIAKRWVKNGNQVTVFCGNDGAHHRNDIVDGVRIVRRGGFYTVYLWAPLYYLFKFRGRFDVIIDSENGIPFYSPLFVKKPVFLLIHHIHQEVHRKHLKFPLYFIAMFLEGKIMPLVYKSKTIITVSESSKGEILKLGLGTQESIEIIHPGIDIENYVLSAKTQHPTFLYLGRLKPWKNVDVIVKAFAQIVKEHPKATLQIAGFGETLISLQELAKELNIEDSVKFLGRVSEKEKVRLLGQAWIALQPSMIEGWGITVIEANACGTPVIASNVNGLRDSIVDRKTGILVKVRDVDAFTQSMRIILEDKQYRESLSKAAYLWSRNFSWDKSGDTFYKRILEIMSKKQLRSLYEEYVTNKSKHIQL